MDAARIKGAHATPKGFKAWIGYEAVTGGVPLNTLQQLLGHAVVHDLYLTLMRWDGKNAN
jgi:hypothetical protein